jgi:hypothetical protein
MTNIKVKGDDMKRLDLPMSQLTLPQKLDLMESLWAELSRNEDALESPDWHEVVLKDREEAMAAGKATTSDWKKAKERIRHKAS